MKHLDLFSGIGGFALAAETVWGGSYQNVGFCDNNKFCQAVLKKHWPEARIFDDIRKLTAIALATDAGGVGHIHRKPKKFPAKTRKQTLGQSVAGSRGLGVDLLTGGFPCQPFSNAGHQKGKSDDRYLWPEMLRVIREVQPTWIIGENVAGILGMAEPDGESELENETDIDGDQNGDFGAEGIIWGIINDLEQSGYDVQTFLVPACAVGAPHRRDRVWIVAHRKSQRLQRSQQADGRQRPESDDELTYGRNRERTASHSPSRQSRKPAEQKGRENSERGGWDKNWLEVATRLCGVDDGLPFGMDGFKLTKAGHRVERIKGLGNAIVPQVAMGIMRAIKNIGP